MIRAALLLSLLWTAEGATWSDAPPADAQRVVTLEVVDAGRVTSLWKFPVKAWTAEDLAARPPVLPVSRWFVALDMTGTKRKGWVFSRTWLAKAEPDAVYVSFEWFPTDKPDAKALAKHTIRVPLGGEATTLSVASSVQVRATYGPV